MIKAAARIGVISMSLAGGVAFAADAVPPPVTPVAPAPASGWTFAIAPYFWMAGMKGEIGQFGLPTVDVDASFSDIMKNFDIGAMVVAEAHNGRFGFAFDIQYIRLEADAPTPFGVIADSLDVTSETFTMMGAAEYRIFDSTQASVDLMAGARLWSVDTDIDLNGAVVEPSSFSDGDTWVDPLIGVRGKAMLSEKVYLTGWGMIGGFGAASELTWDLMGGAGYVLNDRVSLVGGYRALSVDYENDGFLFDVVEHGPIIGAVFNF